MLSISKGCWVTGHSPCERQRMLTCCFCVLCLAARQNCIKRGCVAFWHAAAGGEAGVLGAHSGEPERGDRSQLPGDCRKVTRHLPGIPLSLQLQLITEYVVCALHVHFIVCTLMCL